MIKGFPKIPDFAGLASSGADAAIGLGGAALIKAIFGNVWGLFNEFGLPVLFADNVLGLSYQAASSIAKEPCSIGAFAIELAA